MIENRNKISIKEISLEESQRLKSRLGLKPTTAEKINTIFGIMLVQISYSMGSFIRDVDENLKMFYQINKLSPRTKKVSKKIIFERQEIYIDSQGRKEKYYDGISELEKIIREGKGIDLVFKNKEPLNEEKSERHYYKLWENNLVLVEAKIPKNIIDQGFYKLKRTTKQDYNLLKATLP